MNDRFLVFNLPPNRTLWIVIAVAVLFMVILVGDKVLNVWNYAAE